MRQAEPLFDCRVEYKTISVLVDTKCDADIKHIHTCSFDLSTCFRHIDYKILWA